MSYPPPAYPAVNDDARGRLTALAIRSPEGSTLPALEAQPGLTIVADDRATHDLG